MFNMYRSVWTISVKEKTIDKIQKKTDRWFQRLTSVAGRRAVARKYSPQSADTHYGPRPWTTVRTDLSTDYPATDPIQDHPQNRIKLINNDCTYGFSNRLLVSIIKAFVLGPSYFNEEPLFLFYSSFYSSVSTKFRTVRCTNVSDLVRARAQEISSHMLISFAVAMYERLGSLRKASKICAPSPPPVCSAHSPAVRELVPDFTICSTEFPYTNGPKNISSIARSLSHKWKVRIFLLFAIIIFKNNIKKKKNRKPKKLLDIILGFFESLLHMNSI